MPPEDTAARPANRDSTAAQEASATGPHAGTAVPHAGPVGPDTSATDPDTSATDPDTGATDPDTGATDPGTSATDPDTSPAPAETGDSDASREPRESSTTPRNVTPVPRDTSQPVRFTGPEYRRLLDAARRSLERTGGDLTRTVTVKTPDDRERRAIIGITGQYRPEGVGLLAVNLTHLDQAVRSATGDSLTRLLGRIGPPLRDRPAERQRLTGGRDAAVRSAERSFLNQRGWYHAWLAELAADGTLTRLVTAGEVDRLEQATRVLEWVERRIDLKAAPAQLGELAATITGDTRALGHGTALAGLVLRALAYRLGAGRPKTTEERRDLWDRNGIIVDDLASRVLVLNLAASGDGLGEWLTSARSHGTPFYVTLHQLVTMPVTLPATAGPPPLVHVCENPVVLRRAAAELGPDARPLLCTEGQPSTAFHRLARMITGAGGTLGFHGDFDWPGVAIAAAVFSRHGARPWRFGAADYERAVGQGGGAVALAGTPQPTPWDRMLAETMIDHGLVVHEESVAARLVSDLCRTAHTAP